MLIRARTILPVCREPIADGAVQVRNARIAAVGPWSDFKHTSKRGLVDLGDVALLPGLVNAHCHLEYTTMAGMIPPPRSFSAWVKSLISLKAQFSDAEFAESWSRGAEMLIKSGTTTVANIQSSFALLPGALRRTPLRVISFLELIGLRDDGSSSGVLGRVRKQVTALSRAHFAVGLSPHAPYTTTPALRAAAARLASTRRLRVCTHVGESEEEWEMFMRARGPMFRWLRSQRDVAECGGGSPVQMLERAGMLSPSFLAVHANYLWDRDAARLGAAGASVVHCPNSHAYFGHRRFPKRELDQAGVNICLGTDSLASTKSRRGGSQTLSLFDELRALFAVDSTIPPKEALELVTVRGANALGMAGEIGELSRRARADLIAVPATADGGAAMESVVHHEGPVSAVMIDGKWRIKP